jgi:osmotically-inducible protein OsmY
MKHRPGTLLRVASIAALVLVVAGCNKAADPVAATATAAAGANVADADVSTNVKTALLREERLKGLDIQVVTLKGDVRLIGVVDNQAQIDEVIKVARAADGVHAIHNELTIKK